VAGVTNHVRAGIETGQIVVPGPAEALQDLVTGTVLTAAERLQQAADDAEVIVCPAAARLLREPPSSAPASVEPTEHSRGARYSAIRDGLSGTTPRRFQRG
jgi:class 3 adenylate cyclase